VSGRRRRRRRRRRRKSRRKKRRRKALFAVKGRKADRKTHNLPTDCK